MCEGGGRVGDCRSVIEPASPRKLARSGALIVSLTSTQSGRCLDAAWRLQKVDSKWYAREEASMWPVGDRVEATPMPLLFSLVALSPPSKMDEEGILQLMILYWLRKRRLNRRRYWVHKIHQCRPTYGEYHHLLEQVLSDDEKCLSYIRMKSSTFKRLLDKVGPFLQKRTTNFRKPLPPEERLVLRHSRSRDNTQILGAK